MKKSLFVSHSLFCIFCCVLFSSTPSAGKPKNKIFKNLKVLNAISAGAISASGDVTIVGDLTVSGDLSVAGFNGTVGATGPAGSAAPIAFTYFMGYNPLAGFTSIFIEGPVYAAPVTSDGQAFTFVHSGYYAVYSSFSNCSNNYFYLVSGSANAGSGSPAPGNKIVGTDFAQFGYFLFQVAAGSVIKLYTSGAEIINNTGFHYYG